VKLHGKGFAIDLAQAKVWGLGLRAGLEKFVRPYRNGRDLSTLPPARSAAKYVINLLGLGEPEVRNRFPEVYQHLLTTVKVARSDQAKRSPTPDSIAYLSEWWLFGKPRPELQSALRGLNRFIGTVDTAKHRIFQFVPAEYVVDDGVVVVATDQPSDLGVLQSHVHSVWALRVSGVLEDRPRYFKTKAFDPFPFPIATPEQRERIGALAEELDATRKQVLAEHADLTLTTLYNLREKLLKKEPFSPKEEDQRMRGRVDIIAELHDRLDAAVAEAYGWPVDLSDEEIVARLVALNAERAAEERRGIVRWLRPEYQQKKAGVATIEKKPEAEQIEALLPEAKTAKPTFPRDAIGQTAAVLADLRAGGPLTSEQIALRYKQGRKIIGRIDATLQALARLGYVAADAGTYSLRRAA
jgi:hypothetical protein